MTEIQQTNIAVFRSGMEGWFKSLMNNVKHNQFTIGDEVTHNVENWSKPVGVLKVTHAKNTVVAAIDSGGRRFVGNDNCFSFAPKTIKGLRE